MQNVDFANGYKKQIAKAEEPVVPKLIPATVTTGGNGASGLYAAYAAAIEKQNQLLQQQYALEEQQRRAAMEATINANNQAADKSLKEAYVANMLAKKNLPQQMKAVGISGGASETTLADLQNTYMNNRFGIEENRNDANNQARQAYNAGVVGDYSKFLAKQYDLQGTLADKAFESYTSAKGDKQTVEGYKIGDGNKVYTDGDSLLQALIAQGMSISAARQYLKEQGLFE